MTPVSAHLGVDLDSLVPVVASVPDSGDRMTVRPAQDSVPPSALLGALPGQEPILDLALPPDPRGAGVAGSDPAAFDVRQHGAARFPLAYAWEMLLADEARPWISQPDGTDPASLRPADALGAAVDDLLRDLAGLRAADRLTGLPAVVVPNALVEAQLDRLVAGLRHRHVRCRLLWRPVAAVLAWIRRHEAGLDVGGAKPWRSLGRVLHLHLGLEAWELSALELVAFDDDSGRRWVLPGRRLPETDDAPCLTSAPRHFLEHAVRAAGSIDAARQPPSAREWNLLWSTAALHDVVGTRVGDGAGSSRLPSWVQPELVSSIRAQLTRALGQGALHGLRSWPAIDALVGRQKLDVSTIQGWCATLPSGPSGEALRGAVVTGPLAGLRMPDHKLLAERMLGFCPRVPTDCVLVEGRSGSERTLLAEGAALFSKRAARGEPTYLDTLPVVQTIAMLEGEPRWINLLETDTPWVMGGRTWHSTPEKTKFEIRQGEDRLTLVAHRSGARTCRRVASVFEESSKTRIPVALSIEIVPGQGSPRVEVVPEDRSLSTDRPMLLDWYSADDTGRSPEEELSQVPLICPRLEPRISSAHRWGAKRYQRFWYPVGIRDLVRGWMEGRLDRHVRPGGNTRYGAISLLMQEIRDRDPSYSDAHATAFDSDGCAATAVPGADGKLIDGFVDRVWQAFLAERDADRRSALLTLVGSTSTKDARVLRFLVEALDGRFGNQVADSALHQAWGHCLRVPKHVGAAIQAMASEAPKESALVAMSRLMMYREQALRWVPSGVALTVAHGACARAAECIAGRRFHRVFRSAALCSAYVLRRRKYDAGFLAPGSSANSDVRRVYEAAATAMERTPGRIMGGAVDIRGTVQRLLGYIDGRGSGTLVALAFDD